MDFLKILLEADADDRNASSVRVRSGSTTSTASRPQTTDYTNENDEDEEDTTPDETADTEEPEEDTDESTEDDDSDEDSATDYTSEDEESDPNADGDSDDDSESTDDTDGETEEEQTNPTEHENNRILLDDFSNLFYLVKSTISKLESVDKSNIAINAIITRISMNLSLLKKQLFEYIIYTFPSGKYVSNLYKYNYFMEALKVNVEMLKKINVFTDN